MVGLAILYFYTRWLRAFNFQCLTFLAVVEFFRPFGLGLCARAHCHDVRTRRSKEVERRCAIDVVGADSRVTSCLLSHVVGIRR